MPIMPPWMPAAVVHSSTARFTHAGTGTVRMCFPLPIKSARELHPLKSSAFSRPTLSLTTSPQKMEIFREAKKPGQTQPIYLKSNGQQSASSFLALRSQPLL
jgi:hypothetical protein